MQCKNCGAVMNKDTDDVGLNITLSWFKELFENMDMMDSIPMDIRKQMIKKCSAAHYHAINMDSVLSSYAGDIHGFITFLETTWKWSVKLNEEEKIIIADENKPYCVCPIVDLNEIKSTLMCNCSEGFAEMMFSKILQQDVTAKVIRSVLRGDQSCVYEIRWGL